MPNRANGSNWLWRPTRYAIYLRDGLRCVYCQRPASVVVLSVDHVVPWCAGGTNAITNLVTACLGCNSRRGARPLDRWIAELWRQDGLEPEHTLARVQAAQEAPIDRSAGRACEAEPPGWLVEQRERSSQHYREHMLRADPFPEWSPDDDDDIPF